MKKDAVDKSFLNLIDIMARLRSVDGCPWDAQQTPETLKPYLLEEAYEVLEAIDNKEPLAVREELGDLLLQIVFQSRMFEERGDFDIQSVIEGISAKLIRRHPHVFGDIACQTAQEVSHQWENIKASEKKSRGKADTVLGQIPPALPALMRASKLTARASRAGFDWPEINGVLAKVHEELEELEVALGKNDRQGMEDELGDLLFAVANLGRFLDIDPEEALRKTIGRFISRFDHVEKSLEKAGRKFQTTSLEEMIDLWGKAKKLEKKNLDGE